MNEEIKRILRLVEEGKINSEQASDLINALKSEGGAEKAAIAQKTDRHLKVNITSSKGKNLNIKLPVKFVKGIIKATGKLPVHINGDQEINMQVISEAIENDVTGKIVEMHTNNGDYLEVVIE
jgi:hypothetical protein